MESLIKDLHEALVKTILVHEKLKKERLEYSIKSTHLSHRNGSLLKRTEDIERLERKYAHIRSVYQLGEKNKEESERLRKLEVIHEKNAKDLKVRSNMLGAEHKDRMKVCNGKIEEYARLKIQLEKDKKSYKEDIQRTIDLQLQKKGIKL